MWFCFTENVRTSPSIPLVGLSRESSGASTTYSRGSTKVSSFTSCQGTARNQACPSHSTTNRGPSLNQFQPLRVHRDVHAGVRVLGWGARSGLARRLLPVHQRGAGRDLDPCCSRALEVLPYNICISYRKLKLGDNMARK